MSIPPLVCSSPPPPEQCEDDKEPEDYDFQYHSQPDEDDDSSSYNYENYSPSCIFKTETDPRLNLKISDNFDNKILNVSPSTQIETIDFIPNSDTIIKNFEHEDSALEDLNLEITTIHLQTNNSPDKSIDVNSISPTDSPIEEKIQDEIETAGGIDNIENKDPQSFNLSSSETIDFQIDVDNEAEIAFDKTKQYREETTLSDILKEESLNPCDKIDTEESIKSIPNDGGDDDDFGDFDSFQCSNTDIINVQSNAILNSENPWENKNNDMQNFGDFTATFDEPASSEMTKEFVSKTGDCVNEDSPNNDDDDDDDDFGDFNNFKSSDENESSQKSEDVIKCSNILNICTTDNEAQIMENVNNVIITIFTDDITECEGSVNGSLELNLGETWSFLMDTDMRQPYMVNWNNTLGQKSLLKALCIDSRNILFGSRWNFNMPKYAANLTTSPLQPQKQLAHSNSDNNESTTDKDTNTWIDPFTPHGQEYTYAEALLLDLEHLMATLDQMAHKHSTFKISELLSNACNAESEKSVAVDEPKSLDGFTSEIPSINNIYSSTLSVQPIRQINLPDTHIFTPTDSETPRSKTIHYNSNTIPLAKNFDAEVTKSQTLPVTMDVDEVTTKNDEYWDFQHFKGNSTNVTSTLTEESGNDTMEDQTINRQDTLATQILQPIKIEPIVPTLNWPDPGEVKEDFYDFSDFVSSTSLNTLHDVKLPTERNNVEVNEALPKIESNDDDFETFQSAPLSVNPEIKNSSSFADAITHNSFQIPSQKEDTRNINAEISKAEDTLKTNEAPLKEEELLKPVNYISNNQNCISSQAKITFGSQINSLPVLQPSNVSVVRNQQNSGQILQPLSLEGFSQINWPNPGIDLHDLSRFNPIESVHSLKSDSSAGHSKVSTPVHNSLSVSNNDIPDDDIWGDFVSSAPKPQQASPKKNTFVDDDEWTDFVSSPNVKPKNGLNTISFNVQSNLNMQKSTNQIKYPSKSNQLNLDLPTLNYITPKSGSRGVYADKHLQNL